MKEKWKKENERNKLPSDKKYEGKKRKSMEIII